MRDDSAVRGLGNRKARGTKLGMMAAVVGLFVPMVLVAATAQAAPTAGSVCAGATTALDSLCVESSTNGATQAPYVTGIAKGDRITDFKWLVNADDTGDPSFTAPNVADCLPARAATTNPAIYATAGTGSLSECPWPSVRTATGHSAVVSSGDQSQVGALNNLPDGKYLISVTAADHKIDGVHFVVAGGVVASVNEIPLAKFIVKMNPLPKKTATVRVHVYNDNSSTNGQWDGQTETLITCADSDPALPLPPVCGGNADPTTVVDPSTDMSGFSVSINDVLAQVTTDVYGNQLCTQYMQDSFGNILLDDGGSPTPLMFGGGASGGALAGTESTCISDHYGDIVIPNMGPNRYAVSVTAPDSRSSNSAQWVQTTTLEGGHDWDSWNIEGGTGYDTELIVGGERVTPVAHGFVKLTHSDAERATMTDANYYNAAPGFSGGAPGHGVLTGRMRIGRAYIGSGASVPLAGTNLTNAKEDGPIEDGLISISCLATCNAPTDATIWTGRAAADGSFRVTGLQSGDYSIAFWDESQSYILAVLAYTIAGDQVMPALPPVVSANRTGPPNNRVYTLRFASDPHVPNNVAVNLVGGNNGWSGTFRSTAASSLSAGSWALTIVRTQQTPNPSGSATVMPQAFSGTPADPPPTLAGDVLLPGWFTDLQGSVFVDTNGDGIRQDDEQGIPDFTVTIRTRGNSLQDQGAAVANTGEDGSYDLSQGYPLGQFLIVEAYNPRFKSTGYSYTTDNDPELHAVLSSQVDIAFLPVIGLSAHLDWGVQPYEGDENGGIVGTVSYDVTRNEFDAAFSGPEDYQPSVSDLPVQLWKTKKTDGINADTYAGSGAIQQVGIDKNTGVACDRPDNLRDTDAVQDSLQTCKPYDYYITETFARPTGCQALDVNGDPLMGEMALPDPPAVVDYSHNPDNAVVGSAQAADCVEAPMNGFQIGGNGTVDGNYALTNLVNSDAIQLAPPGGDALASFYLDTKDNGDNWGDLPSDDYVVEVVNPDDPYNNATTTDHNVGGYFAQPDSGTAPRHLYKFTDETSINVMTGDSYVPQGGYVPSGAAPGADYLLATSTIDNIRQDSNTLGAGTVAKCAGGMQTVNQDNNPDLVAAGGTPYVGTDVPVCDAKLVKVVGGRSVNPTFFVYTDVPIPSKFYGLVNDDLNVQTDRRSILLGEVAPVANGPVGIYDENGNWKYTAHSDVNGFYEVILPSMDTYNCPLPAGPCANVYRLVGNDPGTLDHRNLDYNPQFRTIATEFQAWTGVIHPVDQAPTHQGITIEGPAAQFGALSLCKVNEPDTLADQMTPEFFAIDKPYYNPASGTSGDRSKTYVVKGIGFGSAPGSLTLGSASVTGTDLVSWSDTQITFRVPNGIRSDVNNSAAGPYQLSIRNAASGRSSVNGVTFHVLAVNGNSYYKIGDVYEVRSNDAGGAPILTDNTGSRIYTPAHDAWDTVNNTGPAGFSGLDAAGSSVNGGRAIQRAIEAAHGNNGSTPKLIVIYPNTAANYAPHNANAAYFENVVVHGQVQLQGVGPGGVYTATNIVNGTNIDASQFWSATQVVPPGGNQQTSDGSYSDDWRTFANGLTRAGNGPAELPEGEGVLAIAESENQYANLSVTVGQGNNRRTYADLSVPKARVQNGVDGILITGGDQQGNPGNINTAPGAIGDVTAGPTNPGPAQGGAIMLDQYVRDFNITNNQIQSNGGTYGTIRIGTPDLGASVASQHNHNERLIVANNRIVANGGTNLAGALGLFFGADRYTVTGNDFCGNFSAEYGGAISHYGASAGGTISKNRIYYNQSYDEGGGIMIGGALPATGLSQGAGGVWVNGFTGTGNARQPIPVRAGVTIDSNTLISNQSNDDGGGIRFLMAENFPFLVQNNVIANNLSTHDGGGVALDDAPDVTLVNNTIVKNITTGTAATNAAVGDVRLAHPAGLSTGGNSSGLQAILPPGSPTYSNPKMFNNIFEDNRAGWAELPTSANFNTSAIHGIGGVGDLSPIHVWDMGVVGNPGTLTPTNSVLSPDNVGGLQNAVAAGGVISSPTNVVDGIGAVGFVKPVDFVIDSLGWRVNSNVSFPVIVAQMVPVSLLADYHLSAPSGSAFNIGAIAQTGTNAPVYDIDNDARPALGAFDAGADEAGAVKADLAITKTDGVASVIAGAAVHYTVVVTNNGPGAVTGAAVNDVVPATLTGVTWTCVAGAGAACGTASGSGDITNRLVDLANGASATFTVNATLAVTASGTLMNTATVASPANATDPSGGNNSATDTDTIIPTRPTLTVLDNFNRANSNTLNNGSNWSQAVVFGAAAIRVSTNQASDQVVAGQAVWNNPAAGFGPKQGAAFTIANGTLNGDALILKASGAGAVPISFIRVRVTGTQVVVETTVSAGLGYSGAGAIAGVFANGDTITAVANADGSVDVWNGNAYLGQVSTSITGGGRIGIQLPTNARIDNFAGGTL